MDCDHLSSRIDMKGSFGEIGEVVFEENLFNNFMILYMSTAEGQWK